MLHFAAQDLKDRVEACLAVKETTYQTVVARAQLAQQLHETAREITNVCEQLVHDQHMQQQGWSAVVANLEDLVVAFKVCFMVYLVVCLLYSFSFSFFRVGRICLSQLTSNTCPAGTTILKC